MTPSRVGAGDMSSLPEPDAGLVRAILDSIPARVAVLDREYRYIYGNRSLLQFLGIPKKAFIGRTVAEVLGQEALDRIKPHLAQALKGHTSSLSEWITYPGTENGTSDRKSTRLNSSHA